MDYQEQILAFLQQPGNLLVALEVVEHLEALRLRFYQSFWKEVDQALETYLEKSDSRDRWVFYGGGTKFDQNYRTSGIYIKSRPEAFQGSYLSVLRKRPRRINTDCSMAYAGLKTGQLQTARFFKSLMAESRSAGVPTPKQFVWWPAINYLDIYLRSDDFLRQYGLQRAEFSEGIARRVWDYFTALERTLYDLNQELFRVSSMRA